jgi:LPPG:FO 2-phospho-L-lactate transferase
MGASESRPAITVLAGGVGAARFLRGLCSLLDPRLVSIIVNTGDDETFFGLHVSPDLDTVAYTLAGVVHPRQGWGVRGDSFAALESLSRYYDQTWFRLGDRDLATHVYRTDRLRRGATLGEVTRDIARVLRVRQHILPMSDDPVRTVVTTAGRGALPFQDYLVRRRGRGRVLDIRLDGAEKARPAAGVLDAIRSATAVILPPSNPLVSIGPILALRGVRAALRRRRERIAAVSPIVGGQPIKGPLHRMLAGLGHEVSPVGVAKLYRDFVSVFVLDQRDAAHAPRIAALGMRPVVTDTIMSTPRRSRGLARVVLREVLA